LVRRRLEEHGLLEVAALNEIVPGRAIEIGPFRIEPIHVTHSTIDCVALAIRTPAGVIIHTGDFKVDGTPVDGRPFDLHAFARYGDEGVLALLSDSTNIERAGHTPSERAVKPRIEELIRSAQRKVLISCFSSSIHRIQQVIDISESLGRKVAFVGRSMVDNVEISHELGRLAIPDGIAVKPQNIAETDPRKLTVLISGSQAEPLSALSRVAVDNHRTVTLDRMDTVILSARIIPGNEKPIFRMINHMFRRGALVYYEDSSAEPVHVSGHASQEELKLMLNLVRPRYFIPIHGEYRQLFRHAAMVEQMGVVGGRVLLVEDGQQLEFTPTTVRVREAVPVGRVCVDSGSLEEIEEAVIRDRQHLAEDGVVVPIIAIDKHTGRIEGTPEIVTRGLVPSGNGQELNAWAREVVLRTIENSNPDEASDWSVIKEKIRADLRRFLNRQTSKRPLVLPVILEI
jgi:ribonuclease J